jgi:hypothetical protein
VAEVTEIDELAEFFGDEDESGDKGTRDGDENPRGALKIRARPLPKKKTSATDESQGDPGSDSTDGSGAGEAGDGEGSGGGTGGDGGGEENDAGGGDTGAGGGSGGGQSTPAPAVGLRNVRAVILAKNKRRIYFTPEKGGDVRIELEDSGADTNRLLKVIGSNIGSVVDGRLKLACAAHSRTLVEVELERPFEGTVRVKANAI